MWRRFLLRSKTLSHRRKKAECIWWFYSFDHSTVSRDLFVLPLELEFCANGEHNGPWNDFHSALPFSLNSWNVEIELHLPGFTAKLTHTKQLRQNIITIGLGFIWKEKKEATDKKIVTAGNECQFVSASPKLLPLSFYRKIKPPLTRGAGWAWALNVCQPERVVNLRHVEEGKFPLTGSAAHELHCAVVGFIFVLAQCSQWTGTSGSSYITAAQRPRRPDPRGTAAPRPAPHVSLI